MTDNKSVTDDALPIDDRVCEALASILRGAQARGINDEELERVSGVKRCSLKAYRLMQRKASLPAGLAICSSLGAWAVNHLMYTIHYQATELDAVDVMQPTQIVADAVSHLGVIARAAADNRIDHTEEPATTEAADRLIATVLPLSSARRG